MRATAEDVTMTEKQYIASICSGYGSSLLTEAASNSSSAGGASLASLLSCAPRDAADLVQRLLYLNPEKRLSADKALEHEYVRKFHCERTEPALMSDVVLPLRDDKQVSVDDYRNKLYSLMAKPRERRSQTSTKQAPTAPMAPTKASRSYHEERTHKKDKQTVSVSASNDTRRKPTKELHRSIERTVSNEHRERNWEWESRARGDFCRASPQRNTVSQSADKRVPVNHHLTAPYAQQFPPAFQRRSSSSFSALGAMSGADEGTLGRGSRSYGVITASAFMDLRTSMR
ncbi:putative serine/threonine-protein kinase C05D10.2 [Phthorimaea operculella]|nr:putative serine/threonine-protein kinase C05D10.2 [Phthorimaea operculella]